MKMGQLLKHFQPHQSLFSSWSIKIKKRRDLHNTHTTAAEEALTQAVIDNLVIYNVTLKAYFDFEMNMISFYHFSNPYKIYRNNIHKDGMWKYWMRFV